MRVDRVEIKVSFSRDQTPTAVKALNLPSPPPPWQIYFCEDVNPGAPTTPLLDLNVIMRARGSRALSSRLPHGGAQNHIYSLKSLHVDKVKRMSCPTCDSEAEPPPGA